MGFIKIESYRKGIVYSTVFNIVAKLLAFFSSIAIAFYFGTQTKTDLYFYILTTMLLLAGFFVSLDSSVLIPESMRIRQQIGESEAQEFLNFFFLIYFFLGAGLTMLLFIFPLQIFSAISDFGIEVLKEHLHLLLFSIPLLMLAIITTFLNDILTSYRFFTMPMLTSMINSICTICIIFLFHDEWDIISIVIGLLIAYSLQSIILIGLLITQLKWKFKFKNIAILPKTIGNVIYAQLGNFTSMFSAYIPMYFLSGLNPGIITALNYGQKTSDIPTQLVTTQFSSVAAIKFNELYACSEFSELNRIFIQAARFLLFVMMPVSICGFLLSEDLVTLLYRRGQFGAESVQLTADFLKLFFLLLPMNAVSVNLTSRLLMAGQMIKQSFVYQILFNIALVLLIAFFVDKFGGVGYPYALLFLHSFNFIFSFFLLRWLLPVIDYGIILLFTVKVLLVNVIPLGVSMLAISVMAGMTPLLRIFVTTTLYVFVLLIINLLMPAFPEINLRIKKIKMRPHGL